MGQIIQVDFHRRRRVERREPEPISIMSYAQDRDGLVPQCLRAGPRLLLVWEIIDRWPAQDYRYFKVRTIEDAVVFLRHDVRRNMWSLVT